MICRAILVGFACVGLTSCDPAYGILGQAVPETSLPPSEACISAALRNTAGVSEISEVSLKENGHVLLGDGPVDGSVAHYFQYRVGPARDQVASLWFEEYSNERYLFHNDMDRMGEKIPKTQIDEAYPVMRLAAADVSEVCDLPSIKSIIYEFDD